MRPLVPRHFIARVPLFLAICSTVAVVGAAPPFVRPAHAEAPAAAKAAPAAAKKAGEVRMPVTVFKLKNGLTVLVNEDHTVPIVGVDVWYHVGSKEEKPGRTGFAHLFEHLMFQGSEHVGDDEHLRLVTEAGGQANGTTSQDRTNFFEVVPSNFLDRALFLEADRMGWFVGALSQEKLDNQRDVVKNERRQSYENRPYGMVPFAIHESLYPPTHPYHWLPIGDHKDLEAATLDDVKEFFRTWYTPSNASVAIAGDVTVAKAKQLAEKYFGAIPSVPEPRHADVAAVALTEDKKIKLEDRVSLERLYLVWPSPAWFAPGDADLDLLASVLGSKTGRLYQKLVHDMEVAQSVDVGQGSMKLSSQFTIVVTPRPGHTAAEMERLVDEELKKITTDKPVTTEELTRAKNRWEASFTYGLEPVGSFGGRADRMSEYFYMLGKADSFEADKKRYLDATEASVNQTAKQILGGHRIEVTVAPLPKPVAPPPVAPPAATKPAAVVVPPAATNPKSSKKEKR